MTPHNPGAIKMIHVEAQDFEAVGYVPVTRRLYIKFKTLPAMCFDNVPGFRFDGLMAAPRKDAYFKSFIENKFLTKTINLP
jgi:hypothetical protein